jgi:hypothetical protein
LETSPVRPSYPPDSLKPTLKEHEEFLEKKGVDPSYVDHLRKKIKEEPSLPGTVFLRNKNNKSKTTTTSARNK